LEAHFVHKCSTNNGTNPASEEKRKQFISVTVPTVLKKYIIAQGPVKMVLRKAGNTYTFPFMHCVPSYWVGNLSYLLQEVQ